MTATSPNALPEAIVHHQRGELAQAEQGYRAILASQPDHPDALHLLGVLALQCGQIQQSIQLIERAIAREPSVASYHANLAEAYRAAGQLPRAAACCQLSLQLQPVEPDVSNNFGSILMQLNRVEEAAVRFREAVQHRPDFALAHNNLGNAYRVLGDREQSLHHFRRAVELNPQLGFAHGNLGQMLLDSGDLREALLHCREAVRLQPQSAPALNNLGNVLRQLGEMNDAKSCYTEALRLAPGLAMLHANLGQIVQDEGKLVEAVRWLRQAVRCEPNSPRFHTNLAAVLTEQMDFETAEAHLIAALQIDPNYYDARVNFGRLRYEQGRLEEACAEYRLALERQPNDPVVCCSLGEILLELNREDEALAFFRAALRSNPRCGPALSQLASCLRDRLPDDERAALQRLAFDPQLSDADRAPLLFALAQWCDTHSQYAEAAQHLEQANAMELALRQKRGQAYNLQAHVDFIDRLVNVFTPEFFQRVRGFGVDSERPVFIVGLPRSGTTLLEQILSSHSRVFGAGELRTAREDFEALGRGPDGISEPRSFDALQVLDADGVQKLARAHLAFLDSLNPTAARVTDKMPDNYMYLGLLAMLFPKARFLNCRRDPRDVAVSCWITQFRSIPWANDPEHLASRFTQYRRVMEHWRRVLPAPVLDVDYEDIVNDLEGVAHRVVEFCGLDWEPACLEFHKNGRPIRTASVTQVRQPIYRSSLARWQHYEQTLGSLFARLETSSAPPERAQELEETIAGERGASAPC